MRRVLYLLRYYPTLTETFVYREIEGLVEQGHVVTVAALGTRPDGRLNDALPPVPVLAVPRRPLRGWLATPTAGMRWLARHQRPKDVARLPWLARRLGGFERLHVHFAGEAAEWAHALWLDTGIPYSVMVHAADLFKPRPSLDEVLGRASAVLTVAQHHQAILARRGHRALLLRCGPRLGDWALGALPEAPLCALAVGRAVPKKGLDVLLEAWSRLGRADARLVLLSDLPDPGLPGVTVRGLRPAAEVRAEMGRANLVVLPCRRAPDGDMDGVPLVLMEALAAGRPVVTTPVSGIPELVDEAVGWLVPPDEPAALGRVLAATTAEERCRRGRAGPPRLVERGFTLEQQVAGLALAWGAGR